MGFGKPFSRSKSKHSISTRIVHRVNHGPTWSVCVQSTGTGSLRVTPNFPQKEQRSHTLTYPGVCVGVCVGFNRRDRNVNSPKLMTRHKLCYEQLRVFYVPETQCPPPCPVVREVGEWVLGERPETTVKCPVYEEPGKQMGPDLRDYICERMCEYPDVLSFFFKIIYFVLVFSREVYVSD